ncbi:MAG: formate--tetrahydrofolate ligase [Firmicutes bacterium]|nr:formate--tetrahydrofolate ligase [Bacillota bacterium]
MKTDIEIASEAKLLPISQVAESIGIPASELFCYGNYMAKIRGQGSGIRGQELEDDKTQSRTPNPELRTPSPKLILVSAVNPTSAGEGKTTISIGLADALKKTGRKTALALREPSLGPVFGVKGGAAGGGYAQIAPMDDINLHFTGDLHAITSANNLLAAMIDNHIYWGNSLRIRTVEWRRCMDLNDRALRNTVAGLGGFFAREDGFDITAASEVMAALCLSGDADDLLARLGRIVIGYNFDGEPVTAKDLKADGAMAVLLKDAIKPNLVQTLEGTPAFVHGGPFANIAHGCNSVIATRAALSFADYVVTEAGFGADLGAEKFIDIKCRAAGLKPDAAVLVATLRALKSLGGKKGNLSEPDAAALARGIPNLLKHIENMRGVFGLPCVVAINKFAGDSKEEIALVKAAVLNAGAACETAESFAKGGAGGIELAEAVVKAAAKNPDFKFAYPLDIPLKDKIEAVAKKVYGADGVGFSAKALKSVEAFNRPEYAFFPVCIAKTQYSLSDNPELLSRPFGFTLTVRDIRLRAGAGFFVALAGEILLMPGLSRAPNAEGMEIKDGVIKGLF